MTLNSFVPKSYSYKPSNGKVSCQAPSNIALVKYWGKHGEQLPKNASISFTLSNCNSTTVIEYERKSTSDFDFEVYLDGERELGFEPKIKEFFNRVETYLPFLRNYKFTIRTTNSFPHSSGIASSASGMSALASCLINMENKMFKHEDKLEEAFLIRKASFIARLGSGSAARSLEGPLVVWGEHPNIQGSNDLFGIKLRTDIHKNFYNYQDTILLVDKGQKQVSSSVGHNLMHDHPYAQNRFIQANTNLTKLVSVLKNGDLKEFIKIVESEALSLHAMMLTSMPYFILMKPNTLEIINKIWEYRTENDSNICFTLDAGANVHVLYPAAEKSEVQKFIENDLSGYCKNEEYIHDFCGKGATLMP